MSLYGVIGVNGDKVDCYRNGNKVRKPCYLVSGFRIMDIETTEFFDIDIAYLRSIKNDLMLDNRLSKFIFKDDLIVSDSNLIHYKVEDDSRYVIKSESGLFKYGICFVNGKLIPKIKESDCLLYSGIFGYIYAKVFYPYKMEVFNCIFYSSHHLKYINGDLHMKFVICSNGKVGYIKKDFEFCNSNFDKLMEGCISSGVNGMLKLDNTYILDCSDVDEIDNLILPSDCVMFYYFTGSRMPKIKNIVFSPNCVGAYSGDLIDNTLDIGSCYISNLIDDSIKNSLVRWVTECGCRDINFY
jgi:hypothetical protein